jgi:hypothetical protein
MGPNEKTNSKSECRCNAARGTSAPRVISEKGFSTQVITPQS